MLLDVPHVSANALRKGLLEDAEARERLFGGSVTQDQHLLLVASLDDADLARSFAKKIGGDVKRARVKYGKREFVEGPLPVRVERGTLVVSGSADDDAIALRERAGRLEVTLGGQTFAFAAHKVDRVRIDGGDGNDTLALSDRRLDLRAAGDHVRSGDVDVDGVEIMTATADDVSVGDLSATDTFQVNVDADRTTAYGSEDDDQISFGSFGLLGPTFIQLINPSLDRYLTVDGRGGDDIISASSAAVDLTLVGGGGDNVLIGGPGNDHLIGGDGFDDVSGGKGSDVVWMGGDFDRFTWKPGDGSDVVDGGASRDSLSFTGTSDGEAYALDRGRPRAALHGRRRRARAGRRRGDRPGARRRRGHVRDRRPQPDRRPARRHQPRPAADHAARRLQRRPHHRGRHRQGRRAQADGQGRHLRDRDADGPPLDGQRESRRVVRHARDRGRRRQGHPRRPRAERHRRRVHRLSSPTVEMEDAGIAPPLSPFNGGAIDSLRAA